MGVCVARTSLLVLLALVALVPQVAGQEEAIFTYIEGQEITTIDPAKSVDESSLHAVINAYDPLLFPTLQPDGSVAAGPHVAESWQVSDDGLVYTFQLRPGIKFHDGTELTAEDVRFSMDRMLSLRQGFSSLWSDILEVGDTEAVDDHTVVFRLRAPFAPMLATLVQLFIVNEDLVKANQQPGQFGELGDLGEAFLAEQEAGSGPYKIASLDRTALMALERFDDYWRGPARIARVNYRVVLEDATIRTLLRSGEADMVWQFLSPAGFESLKEAPEVVVQEDLSLQLYHLIINTMRAPTDNLHVRRALAYAFDYQTAVDSILKGGSQAQGPVPIRAFGHNPQLPVFTQDLERAREELRLAGLEPGQLSLDYYFPATSEIGRQAGLLLQSNLAEIGVNLNLVGVPWTQIVEAATKPETTPHLTSIFDTLKIPHPDSHTFGIYHPSARGSFRSMAWLDDLALTQLLEEARQETDLEQQITLYQQAQAQAVEDVPSIYVANPIHRIAFRDDVRGYQFRGLLGFDVYFWDFS